MATVEVAVDTEEEDLPQGEDMAVDTAVAAGKSIFVFFFILTHCNLLRFTFPILFNVMLNVRLVSVLELVNRYFSYGGPPRNQGYDRRGPGGYDDRRQGGGFWGGNNRDGGGRQVIYYALY